MKNILTLLTLAIIGTACQHQAPPTRAVVTKPATVVATAPARIESSPAPTPVAAADSLTPEMRATLRQVDLSSLLLAPQPGKAGDYQSVLDGFFGKNPQRLSLAILTATRDSLQPSLYHITGKTHYKKQIACFEGIIQLTKLTDYYDQDLLLSQGGDDLTYVQDTVKQSGGSITNARAYSATASFSFSNSALPASYSLIGRVQLDFWVNEQGKLGNMYAPAAGQILEKALTKGSGLLLKGTWRDVATNLQKPFLVSRDIFLLSPDIIQDFGMGDRGSQVNPKYAKLGWNTYWENDEWWADSPKVALSL